MARRHRALLLPDPQVVPTVTVPEAGRLLGLSRSGAYRAVERGEIPVLRLGTRLLVPTKQLLELLGYGPSHASSGTERQP
jgi:excisionase family DNA binding protein